MTDTISLAAEAEKRMFARYPGEFLAIFKRAHDGRPLTLSSPGVTEGLLVEDSKFVLAAVSADPDAYQAMAQKLAVRFAQGAAIGVCKGGGEISRATREALQCAQEWDCDVVFSHNDKIVTAHAGGLNVSEETVPDFWA